MTPTEFDGRVSEILTKIVDLRQAVEIDSSNSGKLDYDPNYAWGRIEDLVRKARLKEN